ncbi:DUF1467 family protein [Rhodovulum sp. DZ06]|uniref:DUF1467 family protein n=1 Tax=Rhodovulum sp. DZ06 TaxID=3425126 RepID=UPI003D32D071
MISITGAIVVYAVVWFMTLFIILPIRMKSQADVGEVVPGTPASAPEAPALKKRFIITTIITTVLWVAIMAIILSGAVSLDDWPLWQLPNRNAPAQ